MIFGYDNLNFPRINMKEIETWFANFYKKDENVYRNVAVLAKIGGPEVIERLLTMHYEEDLDIQYLAVKTLSQIENNQSALPGLFSAIHDPKLRSRNGSLVQALEGFDVSDHFIDIFKLYLNGSLKAAAMAKLLLDYTEFNISSRTLKKAKKHLHHFVNNSSKDDSYDSKMIEATDIINDLEVLINELE